jgi:hypothetical protein
MAAARHMQARLVLLEVRRLCLMITSEPRDRRRVIYRDRRRVVVGLHAQPVLPEGAGRVAKLRVQPQRSAPSNLFVKKQEDHSAPVSRQGAGLPL